MIRRIAVHGLALVGVLWCLAMIAFIPTWHIRLINAGFLVAFVVAMITFWPEEKPNEKA